MNVNTPLARLKNGWGIASVIVSIVAFVVAFVPCIGLIGDVPLGLIATLLAIVGLIIGYPYERPILTSWLGLGGALAAIVLAVVVTSVIGSGLAAASQQAAKQMQADMARQQAAMRAQQAAIQKQRDTASAPGQ